MRVEEFIKLKEKEIEIEEEKCFQLLLRSKMKEFKKYDYYIKIIEKEKFERSNDKNIPLGLSYLQKRLEIDFNEKKYEVKVKYNSIDYIETKKILYLDILKIDYYIDLLRKIQEDMEDEFKILFQVLDNIQDKSKIEVTRNLLYFLQIFRNNTLLYEISNNLVKKNIKIEDVT
jgi:hypothetical protein